MKDMKKLLCALSILAAVPFASYAGIKDLDFDTLDSTKVSLDWKGHGGGYQLIIWKEKRGSPKNEILHFIDLPESFTRLIINYIRDEGYTRKLSLADY